MAEKLLLTVGKSQDGRKLAIITTGGHPQLNDDKCEVLTVEDVSGWGKNKINTWFAEMSASRPWVSRQ